MRTSAIPTSPPTVGPPRGAPPGDGPPSEAFGLTLDHQARTAVAEGQKTKEPQDRFDRSGKADRAHGREHAAEVRAQAGSENGRAHRRQDPPGLTRGAEGEPVPVEGEPVPVDGEPVPVEGETVPAEGEPVAIEPTPVPVDGEADPAPGLEVTAPAGEAPVSAEVEPAVVTDPLPLPGTPVQEDAETAAVTAAAAAAAQRALTPETQAGETTVPVPAEGTAPAAPADGEVATTTTPAPATDADAAPVDGEEPVPPATAEPARERGTAHAAAVRAQAGSENGQAHRRADPPGLVGRTEAPAPPPTAPAPPSTTPQAPAASPVLLADRIERIHAIVRVAQARGMAQAKLELHPADLGRIDVTLRAGADGITATIAAHDRAAADALEQAGAELRRALEERGVTVARLDVHLGDRRDARRPFEGGERTSAVRVDGLTAEDELPETTTTRIAGLPLGALVDVRA